MNVATVLLFRSQKGGGLNMSSFDVPWGTPASVPGRGVILADLMARHRDDIIISNGVAGTITLLLSK
jgi:hypothetical protein